MKRKLIIFFIVILSVITLFILSKNKDKYAVETLSTSWGLSFQEENKTPKVDCDKNMLKEMNAYYIGNEGEKTVYLTFDAGFENGNTPLILDALKKHNVKACFFLVGNYLEKEPELVQRIVEEGHIVGNHTYHHKDMDKITVKEEFIKELTLLEEKYKEIIGQEMKKFYRPPQGKYNEEQLKWAKEAGYKTCFWSLAYVDWNIEKQPSKEEAIKKLTERIHPGSIVLLHSTSETNGKIMEELILRWKEKGYTFGTLEDL